MGKGAQGEVRDREQQFMWEEIRKHRKPDDTWVVLEGKVYDVTNFKKRHPGGLAADGGPRWSGCYGEKRCFHFQITFKLLAETRVQSFIDVFRAYTSSFLNLLEE